MVDLDKSHKHMGWNGKDSLKSYQLACGLLVIKYGKEK
jgi:hypothetical protein